MVRIKVEKVGALAHVQSDIVTQKNSLGICLNNILQNTIVCASLYRTMNIANSSKEEWIS
jgi:hypothetical protein